jgi:hypothetical protein
VSPRLKGQKNKGGKRFGIKYNKHLDLERSEAQVDPPSDDEVEVDYVLKKIKIKIKK